LREGPIHFAQPVLRGCNSAYVIIPLLLLIRMRKPMPFTRVW